MEALGERFRHGSSFFTDELAGPSDLQTPKSFRRMTFLEEQVDAISALPAYALEVQVTWRNPKIKIEGVFAELLTRQELLRSGKVDPHFNLFFVSEAAHPFGLFCNVHGHVEDDEITFLFLRIARKPSDTTPPWIQAISDKLGGYPHGFTDIFSQLPIHRGPCDIMVKFHLTKPGGYRSKITKRPVEISGRSYAVVSESIKWNVDETTTVGVTFVEGENELLEVETKGNLELNENAIRSACDVSWQILTPFMLSNE